MSKIFAADFETTVYENQTNTEVWAAALCQLETENVEIFHSIEDFYNRLLKEKNDIIVYFHNLKFDGTFILNYLLGKLHYVQAETHNKDDITTFKFDPLKEMPNRTVEYSISSMGMWYTITVKINDIHIYFRDSLKLLPFSLRKIGKDFGTKHKKLEMEYTGYRYAGCKITEEEKKYIANDVLVLKEALEIVFSEGHNKLTIGACCLAEYKKLISPQVFEENFPDLRKYELHHNEQEQNLEQYIRKSYRGGWCYLCHGKEHKIYHNGTTADVNSLYPSMMHSESGNYYPIGYPLDFWYGNYIPDEALKPNRYFFIRIRTQFILKDGYLPFIQIKNNMLYKSTESLRTSDIYNPADGKYYHYYIDLDGNRRSAIVELTLTQTDYYLIKEHYNLYNTEIISGCYFWAEKGIFDIYIDKYKKIKQENKGAKRELAKLFLNNLYGKMATGTYSSFKVGYIKQDESLGFFTIPANDKKPIYIPVGSAITSYARCFTIRAAQKNYHGVDKPGFIYADTDSIHCDIQPNEINGITIHDTNFCAWKLESCWDIGYFERQKTYIEHVTHEDLHLIDNPYYNIKCAGMPENCKQLFIDGLNTGKYSLSDFTIGLKLPGKLLPKRIPGGVVLTETTYEMR